MGDRRALARCDGTSRIGGDDRDSRRRLGRNQRVGSTRDTGRLRAARAAASLAIFAVALGGLTAKHPGAAVGCTTIPLCGPNPNVDASAVWVQMIHRTLALLLVLHLFGMVMMLRKRRDEESPIVVRAAHIALGMVLLHSGSRRR